MGNARSARWSAWPPSPARYCRRIVSRANGAATASMATPLAKLAQIEMQDLRRVAQAVVIFVRDRRESLGFELLEDVRLLKFVERVLDLVLECGIEVGAHGPGILRDGLGLGDHLHLLGIDELALDERVEDRPAERARLRVAVLDRLGDRVVGAHVMRLVVAL